MSYLKKFLDLINGKKTTIVAFICLTTSFLTLKGVLDVDTQVYIDSAIALLAGGANYANYKIGRITTTPPPSVENL